MLSSASDTSFAVSELAALLDSIMPAAGTSIGIPGGLRYTIARARLEVDAPPFDSVEEFSTALARHERGDRAAAIQRVIARANAADPAGALDRRRADPAVAQLRRQLRDADSRVYDQQRAIDALSMMAARPPSGSRGRAVAAGVLIGLTFAGAGELMRDRPTVASPRVEAVQDTSGVEVTPVAMPERVEREPAPAAAPRIEAHAAKRTPRIAPAARPTDSSPAAALSVAEDALRLARRSALVLFEGCAPRTPTRSLARRCVGPAPVYETCSAEVRRQARTSSAAIG